MTDTIKPTTLVDLMRDGELDGYRPYAPDGPCGDIDREVAEENPCDLCGGRCRFRGFKSGSSYIAYACCMTCGHAAEF